MTLNTTQESLLDLLFHLASADVPATASRLSARAARPEADVQADLIALERRGLVSAARCRLTFAGLAIASSRAAGASAARRESPASARAA